MISFNYWRGALLAMLCAGPVFVLPLFFVSMPSGGKGAYIGPLVFALLLSIPFGAAFAFLPVFFGGYVMALWGSRNRRARHPVLWGVAGALMATLIAAILIGLARGDVRVSILFAFAGAVCALLVRLGTRWDDDLAPAPLNAHQGEVK